MSTLERFHCIQLQDYLPSLDNRVIAVFFFSPVLQVAKHRVKTFSGGMRRRLSVALCFLGDPKVLFLGECSNCFILNLGRLWPNRRRRKGLGAVALFVIP